MTFAITTGVPQAGVAFAVVMMIGVTLALSAVAIVTVFFRSQLIRLLPTRPKLIERPARTLEAVAGIVLVAIALNEFL